MTTTQTMEEPLMEEPLMVQALPGDVEMHWMAGIVNECIAGERKSERAKRDTGYTHAHRDDALLFFEHVTGKEVQPGRPNRPEGHLDTGSCLPDGLLVNENAVVLVSCPADSEDHSPLLHIKSDKREWLKSKIKGERQLWLKTNRPDHFLQCQFAMMYTRTRKCYYISYDPRPIEPCDRMAVIELLTDEKTQQVITDRINCFIMLLISIMEQL